MESSNNISEDHELNEKLGTDYNYKRQIVWHNVIKFLILHLVGIYGLYLIISLQIKFRTALWVLFLCSASGEGITMGAHRLFAHKSYKAKLPLRALLLLLQTVAGQNSMYIWVRDHRVHHKFSDTDADPHNASLGFFFSHIGWLCHKKHPLVTEKGKTVDMSDLQNDPLVMFQKKYYLPLYLVLAIIIPTMVPVYFWEENYWNSLSTSFFFRYVCVLNQTWLVNSAAHIWGTKPFDKYIMPSENGFVSFVTGGEGWHNYHHTFPWDYRTSEFGSKYNATSTYIEFFKYLGWAYDLKSAPFKMVERRSIRTGDGCHPLYTAKLEKTYRWGENKERDITEINKYDRNTGLPDENL